MPLCAMSKKMKALHIIHVYQWVYDLKGHKWEYVFTQPP